MKPRPNPPHRSKNPAVLINDIELILKVFIKTPLSFLPFRLPALLLFFLSCFLSGPQAAHCLFSFN